MNFFRIKLSLKLTANIITHLLLLLYNIFCVRLMRFRIRQLFRRNVKLNSRAVTREGN